MKKAFMLLGLAALVLAVSCTNENLKTIEPNNKTFEGDVAYIVVNINDVNDASTRASSSGFEYGTADEYAVYDAHFYFYGSDGEFVAESDVWDGGTASEGEPTNIEFKGNTVVTLHGLSGTDYPNWVVTVLNQPAGFTAPKKLDDFATALAENNDNGYGTPGEYGIYTKGAVEVVGDPEGDGSGSYYFTMCTSSFYPADDSEAASAGYSSTYYFATPVVEANFALEDIEEDGNGGYKDANGEEVPPITIYVERLVAKTRVGLGAGLADQSATYNDGEVYYKIDVQEEIDETVEEVNLYVHFEGWELNGVSNNTYMAKRIDTTSWPTAAPFDGWNDYGNYRSYWAMSTAYADYSVTWPDSSLGNDYDDAKNMNPYLRWFDYDTDYIHKIGADTYGEYDVQYCGENTNTAKGTSDTYVIGSKRSAAITNALIFATVGELSDEGVFTPVTLVRENGVLYTEEGYLNYAASHIYLYTKEDNSASGGDIIFTRLSPDYLELATTTDGYVKVQLNQDALGKAEITALYESTDEADTGVTLEAADEYIDEHFNAVYGYGANGYNEGMMYYSIPIEHLNQTEMDKDDDGIEIPYEGTYGMVRNHIYSLTITGIENIGWGVWDPSEVIIPQEDVETYSLTAQINILSWKLVEQSVTL